MYQTIKTGLKSMSLNEADRRKIEESIEIIEFVSCTNCSRLWNLDARMYQDEFRTSTLSCCCHTVMRGCFSEERELSWAMWRFKNVFHRVLDCNLSKAINILTLFLMKSVDEEEASQ